MIKQTNMFNTSDANASMQYSPLYSMKSMKTSDQFVAVKEHLSRTTEHTSIYTFFSPANA
jgi:hypothetical protein